MLIVVTNSHSRVSALILIEAVVVVGAVVRPLQCLAKHLAHSCSEGKMVKRLLKGREMSTKMLTCFVHSRYAG